VGFDRGITVDRNEAANAGELSSVPGLHVITVKYAQSVNGAVPAGSNPLAFTGSVAVNVQLDFTSSGTAVVLTP